MTRGAWCLICVAMPARWLAGRPLSLLLVILCTSCAICIAIVVVAIVLIWEQGAARSIPVTGEVKAEFVVCVVWWPQCTALTLPASVAPAVWSFFFESSPHPAFRVSSPPYYISLDSIWFPKKRYRTGGIDMSCFFQTIRPAVRPHPPAKRE